ncbi:MAG: hypothetical protein LBS36_11215 [Oscillospiraceae bacterium]|jgi:hypothetical protein|nr:hypothetical protein [Oscillospiraceae bacterium]
MKQLPAPLFNKILFTGLIGAGCMLFGLVYFITVRDRVLLILSIALFANCIYKAFAIYRIAVKRIYEVVEGTCVGVSTNLIGKFKNIRILDDAGAETTLRLSKSCKLKIGKRYLFYFDNRNQFHTGSSFFDKSLAAGYFLGYEQAPSEKETPTDT